MSAREVLNYRRRTPETPRLIAGSCPVCQTRPALRTVGSNQPAVSVRATEPACGRGWA